jgi:hypothetical protein
MSESLPLSIPALRSSPIAASASKRLSNTAEMMFWFMVTPGKNSPAQMTSEGGAATFLNVRNKLVGDAFCLLSNA